MIRAGLIAMLLAVPAAAQTFGLVPGEAIENFQLQPEEAPQTGRGVLRERDLGRDARISREAVASASGAVLRGLDKVSGEITDLTLQVGQTARVGRLEVSLGDCRYPVENPAGDAYAWLEIRREGAGAATFAGWMIASSPALNPLDDSRYDLWVIRCANS